MYDLHFLLAPQRPLDGRIVYFCGAGDLRSQMRLSMEAVVAPDRLVNVRPGAMRLGSGLFGGLPFCDVSQIRKSSETRNIRRSAIRSFIDSKMPAILFVSGACDADLRAELSTNCLLIEECCIDKRSIGEALTFLISTTDLLFEAASLKHLFLEKYFTDYLDHMPQSSFADIRHEFERVVLLFVDELTGDFRHEQAARNLKARSLVARPLKSLILYRDEHAISELMQGLENRNPTGTGDHHIRELLAQTRRLAQAIFHDGTPAITTLVRLAIWSSLLLSALKSDTGNAEVGSTLVDQISRGFLLRSEKSALSRPLSGLWSTLRVPSALPADAFLRGELLKLFEPIRHPFEWLKRWTALLQGSLEIIGRETDSPCRITQCSNQVSTFAEVVGQQRAIGSLKRRCFDGEHSQPLVLCGPDGVGKHTLARIYARASVCERLDSQSANSCGVCQRCKLIEAGATLHILDGKSPGAAKHMHNVVLKTLVRGSFWGRHVVIADNVDGSVALLDMCMKTLERRPQSVTFIFLVRDIEEMNPACRSRCEVLRLSPLTMTEITTLANRHIESLTMEQSVGALLASMSSGLPGDLLSHIRRLQQCAPTSPTQVLQLFGLDWGRETCSQLNLMLQDAIQRGSRFRRQVRTMEALGHFQASLTAIYQVYHGKSITEPALRYRQTDVEELAAQLRLIANDLGKDFLDIWREISEELSASDDDDGVT